MRTTIDIDPNLVERASQLTGLAKRPALIREALNALIAREAARRLAQLGGSEPKLVVPPRRRSALAAA